ncbi:hypothetical protein [Chryseobacterium cucumeris]|uniref:hypothetical protein n=1 Tax=Chryseobacterium cucumeris TaxID=1813611 RepID=UPI00192DA23C|nr:hypothetical protein [Chryseobacterium cucumeris]QRA41698.1 hypothetical protein JNG87_13815 [Chryseobacterium cucumeris]
MMKILNVLMVPLLFVSGNNNGQEKKDIHSIIGTKYKSDSIVENVLKKQLKQGSTYTIDEAGVGLPKIQFETKELEATAIVAHELLNSNGYNTLGTEDFNKKIKNIFGRIIDSDSQSHFLYVNFLDKCDKEFVMYRNNGVDYEGLFIDKQRKLITDLYYIPELIDYKKEYSRLNDFENINITRKSSIDNLDITIPHWKDVTNLNEIRKKTVQTLVARNMLLFNNNKSYAGWLAEHDKVFVKMLVKNFGFTKELQFNDLVMKDYLKAYQTSSDIGDIIFVKNCKGELEIRTELLKYIKDHTKADENRLLNALENFGYVLKDNINFTLDEKYKILAYIGNTVDPFYLNFAGVNSGNAIWNAESLLYNSVVKDRNIISVFQKNNYYGLPDLKDSLIRVQAIIEHSSE